MNKEETNNRFANFLFFNFTDVDLDNFEYLLKLLSNSICSYVISYVLTFYRVDV